jgi:eukaryotic-like serine/threonine-protein kinase
LVSLGPFDVHRRIAVGGMGEVYSGVHRPTGLKIAVKVLRGERADSNSLVAFRDEAQAVASLDHPNIIRLFDYGTVSESVSDTSRGVLEAGNPFLIMEYLDGGNLGAVRDEMDWIGLRRTLAQLLDALGHSHARGIVHRDIKPGNILLADADRQRPLIKLTDYGIAHGFRTTLPPTMARGAHGTLRYMAPEQFLGQWRDYGPWTDIWAVGIVAYEIVCGRPPFFAASIGELVQRTLNEPPSEFEPRFPVPRGFESWLGRCLTKRARGRYRYAAEARWALDLIDPDYDVQVDIGGAVQPSHAGAGRTTMQVTSNLDRPPVQRTWRHRRDVPQPPPLPGVGLGLVELRDLPLVGRDSERDLLWEAFTDVESSRCVRVAVVRGPMGVGKTHLARWLVRHAHEVGAAEVLWTSHFKDGGARHGLRAMLTRLLRCTETAHGEVESLALAYCKNLGKLDPEWARAVADWLVPRPRESLSMPFAPGNHKPLIRTLLKRLTSDRPVIVWLDDVQWGADSLELVQHLLDTGATEPGSTGVGPVLFVLTARDEDLTPGGEALRRLGEIGEDRATRKVRLGPLERGEHMAFVQGLLGLSPRLAAEVASRSKGNPMYAVQVVREWRQKGLLRPGDDGFEVSRVHAPPSLPETLADVWDSRVDELLRALPIGSGVALNIAAILGMEVDLELWRKACGAADVTPSFQLVVMLYTNRLAQPLPTGWAFAHTMLRDCLLRRAHAGQSWHRLNAACARAVRDSGEGEDPRLGRFLLDAAQPGDAVGPLNDAARRAVQHGEFIDALRLLDLHETALTRVGAPTTDARWGQNLTLQATVQNQLGATETAESICNRVRNHDGQAGWDPWVASVTRILGHLHYRSGEHAEAEETFRVAAERAHTCGDLELHVDCLRAVAHLQGIRGEVQAAVETVDRAVAMSEGQPGRQWAASLTTRGIIYKLTGAYQAAERDLRLGMKAAHDGNLRGDYAHALNALGGIFLTQKRWAEAEKVFREVLALRDDMGIRSTVEAMNLAQVLNSTGRRVEAGELLEGAIATIHRQGPRNVLAQALLLRLPWRAQARDWAGWDVDFSHAVEDSQARAHGWAALADAAEHAGEVTLECGEPERARRALEYARRLYSDLGDAEAIDRVDGFILRSLGE